jgi:serine phosphatase RsbU (regulator of sigma subunit)
MSNLHILVVDDEVSILMVIASYLAKQGDKCATAASGEQALALVQESDFDIVLADLTMSGIDGLELTRRVKIIRPQTVCILMSGMGTRFDIIAAMKLGVFDFLDKPFSDLAVLAVVIERAAASRRLVRERDALLDDLKRQNAKLETSLARLHSAYGQLRRQEATLTSDLRQSQRVQRKLLPSTFPSLEGCELFGYFSPCERLGGDFFNAMPLWDGRLAVYLVDVAGHGVSAAMITIMLREILQPRRLLQASYEILGTPDKALAFLNQALLEEAFDPPILITMVYVVIDPKNGTIAMATAGHPPPIVVNGPGLAQPLSVSGPVLGMHQAGTFTTTTAVLNPGDSLLLYTDGVSEARYEGGSEFTVGKLCEMMAGQHGKRAGLVGQAIEKSLLYHLDERAAADDMTFIVISRLDAVSTTGAAAGNSVVRSVEESVRVVLPSAVVPVISTMPGNVVGGWSAATCVIRLRGMATWQAAPAIRQLVAQAETEGTGLIRMELVDCQALDSTILGILYQYAKKLILHRPSERVCAQLREMGIFAQFQISEQAAPETDTSLAVNLDGVTPAAYSHLILSAHGALMEASEENRRRFQDVMGALGDESH